MSRDRSLFPLQGLAEDSQSATGEEVDTFTTSHVICNQLNSVDNILYEYYFIMRCSQRCGKFLILCDNQWPYQGKAPKPVKFMFMSCLYGW